MLEFDGILNKLPEVDMWEYLKNSEKDIVLYGMGNGADKIISQLEKYGLSVSDFFASDDFVRGQYFHSKKVLKFTEIKEKYDNFVVLVSFGSELCEVIANIEKIDGEAELYLPDVPVAGEEIFTREFFALNKELFEEAFNLLSDNRSREVFFDMIMYKLTGKLRYLLSHTDTDEAVYNELLKCSSYKSAVDLGAYNGDSAGFMAKQFCALGDIIAFEPDKKNFDKLLKNTKDLHVNIEAHNICAWSRRDILEFDRAANRNSSVGTIAHTASVGDTKKIAVFADSLDNIAGERKIDFVKYDVEGSELCALTGSEKTIKSNKCDLVVSVYHKSRDLFELVLKVRELLPDHELYLRRKRCVPAWEISLIAVKR